jgi:hypothetical protein
VFCAQAGLRPDRPMLLYVGSALFQGSPAEVDFVTRWVERVRASRDPNVRDATILIRPHPQRMDGFDRVDWSKFGDVAVWGGNPVTEQARADYYDSLFHSAAVVGLNTSAFLEAGIVGRPVLAILPPEYEDNQEGTLHFRYLTDVAGGLLRISRTFDEHEAQLAAALGGSLPANTRFIETFLRPAGIDAPATPVFVEAVEALASIPVRASRPAASLAGRAALDAVVRVDRSRKHRDWLMDEEDRRATEWRRMKGEIRARNRRAGMTAEEQEEAERQMRAERRLS